jgi:hypothetical protein
MKDPDKRIVGLAEVEAQLCRDIDRLTERVNEIAGFLRGQVQFMSRLQTQPRRKNTRERARRSRARKKGRRLSARLQNQN